MDLLRKESILTEQWTSAMRRGDFSAAWEASTETLKIRRVHPDWQKHRPIYERDVWDGSSVDGKKILVRCHHGLGDTIQFVRYCEEFRKRVARIVLKTPAELIPLLRTSPGIDAIASLEEPDPEHDVDIEIMEFPFLAKTTLNTIPRRRYLHVPDEKLEQARKECTPFRGLRIGLCWAVRNFQPERTIPLFHFSGLWNLPNIHLFSLQRHAPGSFPFALGSDAPPELVSTAALISNLDLVITVDTMIAHLAGALHKPVWTLLPYHGNWRWMENRDDSPWYPTMRLFRQPKPGDWQSPIGGAERLLRESWPTSCIVSDYDCAGIGQFSSPLTR